MSSFGSNTPSAGEGVPNGCGLTRSARPPTTDEYSSLSGFPGILHVDTALNWYG